MEQRTLKLNEFKELYKSLQTGIVFIDYLFFSFIYWLENKVIDSRVKNEVDEAIKTWETLHKTDLPDMVTPVYSESPSKTSTSLPEMRLTAPWYVSPDDTVEGR